MTESENLNKAKPKEMKPNQKVICIDDSPPQHPGIVDADRLVRGALYVLSAVSMRPWGLGVRLVGFNHGYADGHIWIRADRFAEINKKNETLTATEFATV